MMIFTFLALQTNYFENFFCFLIKYRETVIWKMAEEAPRDSTSKFKAAALAATAAAAMKSGRQDPEYLRVC